MAQHPTRAWISSCGRFFFTVHHANKMYYVPDELRKKKTALLALLHSAMWSKGTPGIWFQIT
jgi:hypothetical protein